MCVRPAHLWASPVLRDLQRSELSFVGTPGKARALTAGPVALWVQMEQGAPGHGASAQGAAGSTWGFIPLPLCV